LLVTLTAAPRETFCGNAVATAQAGACVSADPREECSNRSRLVERFNRSQPGGLPPSHVQGAPKEIRRPGWTLQRAEDD
jgi:hypothetical protein